MKHKSYIESEHRYKQVVNGLPAAFYTCDAQGRILLYNDAAVALWGREPDIAKDRWCGSWRIYKTDGSPLPLDECPMSVAIKEKRPVHGEEIIIERPDGVRRHVMPHPEPIFDHAGNLLEGVNMLVDITEKKRATEALKESEEQFKSMADHAPLMIWMTDADGNVCYLNRQWTEFTGMNQEEGLGSGWSAIIHPEDKAYTFYQWQQAFENRKAYVHHFRYLNKYGEYRTIEASFSPRLQEPGKFIGFIALLNDVTLLENAKSLLEDLVEERTRELIQSNLDLARSNNELEEFASVASHDLQEPLRKIQTFSQLLEINLEDKTTSKLYLKKITDSAKRMMTLIQDLLNLSKFSSKGELISDLNLDSILKEILNDLDLVILEKKAVIRKESLPVIEGVEVQLYQLFYNLMSNALKFSGKHVKPVINISSKVLSPEEVKRFSSLQPNVTYHQIVFKDNGIGFLPQYSEQIFTIFQRLHSKSEYEGTGIGLAICKKVVLNHHGLIYATSQENEGASFYVILPEKQPNNAF